MAALALGLQLVVGALQSARQPSIEIGPAVGVGQPQRLSQQLNRAQAQYPEPQRRVSGAVGEFGSD